MTITPSASHAEHYAKIVSDKALSRNIAKAGQEIQDLRFNETVEPVDALNQASEVMNSVTSVGNTNNTTTL